MDTMEANISTRQMKSKSVQYCTSQFTLKTSYDTSIQTSVLCTNLINILPYSALTNIDSFDSSAAERETRMVVSVCTPNKVFQTPDHVPLH